MPEIFIQFLFEVFPLLYVGQEKRRRKVLRKDLWTVWGTDFYKGSLIDLTNQINMSTHSDRRCTFNYKSVLALLHSYLAWKECMSSTAI